MIVWGGIVANQPVNTGARYDPAADTWTPTSTVNAPPRREGHTAIWTGTEMIVWGGSGSGFPFIGGGRYHPVADTWTRTSSTDEPAPRSDHTAVWTGTEMIVWGGSAYTPRDTGGRYNPVADTWVPTSTTNAATGRARHTAVWTGTQMIVWGGDASQSDVYLDTGGRYTPDMDSGPLTADAGPDLVVECASAAGTVVQLHGVSSGCGPLTYTWTGPFAEGQGSVQGADAAVTVPFGQSTITLKVEDAQGHGATDTVVVGVRDTTPPVLAVLASPPFLWPPRHNLVPVHIDGQVRDLCDPNPAVTLVSVTSSEPDDASGPDDGQTAGDIADAVVGTPDWDLELRAERAGTGPGRSYQLTYRAVDASGNAALGVAIVTVPHDRKSAPGSIRGGRPGRSGS
jgi:hypothetical protein